MKKVRLSRSTYIRGQKMVTGKGWVLHRKGSSRALKATLITKFRTSDKYIAIFKVI